MSGIQSIGTLTLFLLAVLRADSFLQVKSYASKLRPAALT